MTRLCTYRLLLLVLLLPGLSACRKGAPDPQSIDWSTKLEHERKTPYGSALAYESFPEYFPGARRESISKYFRYTSLEAGNYARGDSAHMLVMLGLNFKVTNAEWQQLLRFIRNGNEVFLLTAELDPRICRDLHLQTRHSGSEIAPLQNRNTGEASEKSLWLGTDSTKRYGFNGRYINGWFETGVKDVHTERSYFERRDRESSESDEDPDAAAEDDESAADYTPMPIQAIDTHAQVLGRTANGPNFIRYRIGSGHLTLHAAPLTLSNYFLLQPQNRPYLDGIWHQFPAAVSRVYWNEFFIRKTDKSSFKGLLKYPAMRYALLIAALTLLLYVLFSMKRRQRIIPVIAPLENASVSFVETVGRLYFNKGNHQNLAEKMVQHFLEWVRSNYYLDTSRLDPAFVQHLSMKSGKPVSEVESLVSTIHELRLGSVPATPAFLIDLYRRIQSFY